MYLKYTENERMDGFVVIFTIISKETIVIANETVSFVLPLVYNLLLEEI
jgi:hypothetical protein